MLLWKEQGVFDLIMVILLALIVGCAVWSCHVAHRCLTMRIHASVEQTEDGEKVEKDYVLEPECFAS